MTKKFKSLLTDKGKALIADAIAGGKTISLKYFAVGDGNGSEVTPSTAQTALVNEVARIELNSVKETDANKTTVAAEAIIPADKGGFWIREAGIFTADGVLVAVSQMPVTYKPDTDDGATSTQTLRMYLAVSDASAISLTVDDSLIIATEAFVNEAIEAHAKSRNHPDASLTEKGFVQLSSKANSDDEDKAATPKAVKAANDNAEKRLEKENNLSDISDKAEARGNLELGTAAIKNVQESRDDTSPGSVLVNGGALALRTVAAKAGTAIADASALPANSVSFCYSDATYSPGYEATILDVGGLGGDGYRVQYAASYADGGKQLKFRTLNADNGYWGSWTNVLTNYGGDVDHLSNASYYHINPAAWPGAGAFAEQYSNPVAPFIIPYGRVTPKDNSQYLPIVKALSSTEGYGYGAAVSFGILRTGNADFGSAVVNIIGDNGNAAVYSFDINGAFNAPGQLYSGGTIHAEGQISNGSNIVAGQGLYESGGAVRVYSSNNPPPLQSGATTTGNNSAYYSHANGQIFMQCIGGVYSNAKSNPDVTVYLPASFPNGIIAISGSYSGTGGSDEDSWWTASPASANSFNLHTRNMVGTFSFVVTGY